MPSKWCSCPSTAAKTQMQRMTCQVKGTQVAKVFLLKNKSQEDSSQMFTACGEIARPTAPERNNHLSSLSQCKGDKCANEKYHSLASSSESHSWKEQSLTQQNHSGTANHTRLSPQLVPCCQSRRPTSPCLGRPYLSVFGGKARKASNAKTAERHSVHSKSINFTQPRNSFHTAAQSYTVTQSDSQSRTVMHSTCLTYFSSFWG